MYFFSYKEIHSKNSLDQCCHSGIIFHNKIFLQVVIMFVIMTPMPEVHLNFIIEWLTIKMG
jgi:hypothetical protein